jgi:hypothetical protein
MKSWIWLMGLACSALCCHGVAAQSVFQPPVMVVSRSKTFGSQSEAREAKPFGANGQQLPGTRIAAASSIVGKWSYRESRSNAEINGVRVPQRTASLLLELKSDGSYVLNYDVYWGGKRGGPEDQHAGEIVKETGRFAVSGSILLLEADPVEVLQQGKFERKQQTLAGAKRAYVARMEGSWLNIAGPCAAYQVDAVCKGNRTVLFPLARADATRPSVGR